MSAQRAAVAIAGAALALSLAACGGGHTPEGVTVHLSTGQTAVYVPVRDLNIVGVCGEVCPVQYDPSGSPDDTSGWTGTASRVALEHELGFSLSERSA